MINCHVCGHPRLLHDSWGCRHECSCGVSIIYLTPQLAGSTLDPVVVEKLIKQANELVVQQDRVEESHIRGLVEMTEPVDDLEVLQ